MQKQKILLKIIVISVISIIFSVPIYATEEHDEHSNLFKTTKVLNGSVLNVKDCVAIAFKNSPSIRRKKYELDIAKSNVSIAKSRYFPVIGAGVGFNYQRNSDSIYYDKRYRDLPYIGITINQLVYDFGKTTANIKMEKFYQIGAEFEFVDELCHTLFHIKERYYNLLNKEALLKIAEKDVEINKEFVKIAKDKPDLATAEVNLSEAEIRFVEANKELQIAKYNLSNAMYLDNHINYSVNKTPTFDYDTNKTISTKDFIPVNFPFKKENATDIAYKNSPDLQILVSTKNAMEQNLKYIKRSFLPDLKGDVGYGLNNTYDSTNNSLQVGVGLETEINFKELKHNIDLAKAEINIADNEIVLFKKDLYYEVKRALNNVERTQEQIPVSIKEVSQAQTNLNLVINGYKSGKLNYIALQNARNDYINSQKRYITSLYNYNMAIIQTEIALHYHIVDIQHAQDHALHSHADELIEHFNKILKEEQNNSKSEKNKHKKQNRQNL